MHLTLVTMGYIFLMQWNSINLHPKFVRYLWLTPLNHHLMPILGNSNILDNCEHSCLTVTVHMQHHSLAYDVTVY